MPFFTSLVSFTFLLLWFVAASGASAQSSEQSQYGKSAAADALSTFENEEALLHAALAGRSHEVHQLLEGGANVNAQNAAGQTPLIVASAHNHHDLVVELLFAGANPNLLSKMSWERYVFSASDRDRFHAGGVTSLMIAASNGHLSVVETLLNSGATVNQVNKFGISALMLASYEGHYSVVEALLKNGALHDFRSGLLTKVDDEGWRVAPGVSDSLERSLLGQTAETYAYWNGHGEVIVLLVEARKKSGDTDADDLNEHLSIERWKKY